ncbi:hypothetical protein [Planctomicrobium sp. SH664]|uniref:hypothetical protein n=1 Tax=Planctomicrobium sp. SH664 TaxID=3448125 RepID=UPI003F5BEB54
MTCNAFAGGLRFSFWICLLLGSLTTRAGAETGYTVRQITHGPHCHFFGYIGHVGTTPWNASGRYLLALQTDFQDRMPHPGEAANVVLIDTQRDNEVRVVDQCRAWNFQQGTMFYWNPQAPETQFFFNDRDPETNRVRTVLYDLQAGKRVREFESGETPFGNSGVAQQGGQFLGLNYGRMARLRPVTGYPVAFDWTGEAPAPANDGIFLTDVATGESRLLVSFATLQSELQRHFPMKWKDLDRKGLFINHTLWNRDGSEIYFYCRGDFEDFPAEDRVNVPFTIRPDGTGLTVQEFIGGHLEWNDDGRVLTPQGDLYNTTLRRFTGKIPGLSAGDGDIALSPDGRLIVKGFSSGRIENRYAVISKETGLLLETKPFSRGEWTRGPLRIDGAPAWNRDGTQFAFTTISEDAGKTRQMFIITLTETP